MGRVSPTHTGSTRLGRISLSQERGTRAEGAGRDFGGEPPGGTSAENRRAGRQRPRIAGPDVSGRESPALGTGVGHAEVADAPRSRSRVGPDYSTQLEDDGLLEPEALGEGVADPHGDTGSPGVDDTQEAPG